MPRPTGTCALCRRADVLLCDSHIIPRWGFKRLRNKNGRVAESVYLHGGIAIQKPQQHTEHMLCEACEQRFRARETYVASLVPEGATGVGIRALPRKYLTEDTAILDSGSLDREAIAYFALSVVWRAAVAKKTLTSVRLGPYEESIRSYLLEPGNDFPGHTYVVLATYADAATPDTLLDRVIILPETIPEGTHRTHRFLLCGLDFQVAVGKRTPPFMRRLSLNANGVTGNILLSHSRGATWVERCSRSGVGRKPSAASRDGIPSGRIPGPTPVTFWGLARSSSF